MVLSQSGSGLPFYEATAGVDMQSPNPSEDRANAVNNSADFRDQEFQDGLNSGQFHTGRPRGVAYGYYQGEICIVLHIGLWRIKEEFSNFCVIFYSAGMEKKMGWHKRVRAGKAQRPLRQLGHDYIEEPVLVSIVQVPHEGEERREGRWSCRSVVRLYALDFCPHSRAQGVDSFKRPLGEVFRSVGNGKL